MDAYRAVVAKRDQRVFLPTPIPEESLRVKMRIAEGLAARGWIIPTELRDEARQALPPQFGLERRPIYRQLPGGIHLCRRDG